MESVYIDRICFSGKPGNSRTFAYTVHAPRPAIGEVLVAVHAVCLMPGDVAKLGCAFSGTVVFAPSAPSMADDFEKVHDWKAGDKVWGRSDAGWALSEIITVPAYALHKKDPKKSFAECATLGGPALLACRAVQQAFLGPEEKPKILVHGAHTALGTFAVQFAKVTNAIDSLLLITGRENSGRVHHLALTACI
jgi:NADPH:quinone reductase-like Zn-dependent oxidoreductase